MLNLFYCHGFASSFDPNKSKIHTLARLGSVGGCHIDYTSRADKASPTRSRNLWSPVIIPSPKTAVV